MKHFYLLLLLWVTTALYGQSGGKLPQSLAFPNIPNKYITDRSFLPEALASSGLPVRLDVLAGGAYINGDSVFLTGQPGPVIIRASQIGNETYQPAMSVTRTFIVLLPQKKPQTIVFPALQPKIFTDPPFTIRALSSVGLPVFYQLVSGPAEIRRDTVILTGEAGKVVIRAFNPGTDAFAEGSMERAFVVKGPDKKTQTLTFGPIEGQVTTNRPFKLGAVASSGLPVQYLLVAGPATMQGDLLKLTGKPGEVIVKACQAGDSTYLRANCIEQRFSVTEPTKNQQTLTFQPIANKLTSAAPFAITATTTSELPVKFRILSGPATIKGNIVTPTGEAGSVTVTAFQPGNNVFEAARPVNRTFSITYPEAIKYCNVSSNAAWHEWIAGIKVNDKAKTSTKTIYSNFSGFSFSVVKGEENTLVLTTGFNARTHDEYWRVWIDYNQNGSFNAGELAFQGVLRAPEKGTETDDIDGTFTVPKTAITGATRMRVAMRRGAYPLPCQGFDFGEIEDYSIVLLNPKDEEEAVTDIFADIVEEIEDNTPVVASELHIAPNPASAAVRVDLQPYAGSTLSIQVFNQTGKTIYHRHYPELIQKEEALDVTGWKEGTYTVVLTTDTGGPIASQLVVLR